MKILIAGMGGIGQRHLRNLRSVLGAQAEIRAVDPRTEIPVLTDSLKVEAGTSLGEKYDLQIHPDLDSALQWKPEVVFVCNPTSMHLDTARQAARAGCHLFIEKPLSHNLDGVKDLLTIVERGHLTAVLGYQMRFHPCLQRLHALLQNDTLGRVLSVRAEIGEYLPGWHTYEDYRQMYASRRDLGGGVILSQIHEMDYLYWFLGLPIQVVALGGHLSNLEVDVEDLAEVLMEFQVAGRTVPVSLHVDYLQRPPVRTCCVIGQEGKVLTDLSGLSLTVFDAGGHLVEASTFPDFQRNNLFLDEIRAFMRALQGESTPLVSLADGIQSLRMALAARESLASGKVIKLKRN